MWQKYILRTHYLKTNAVLGFLAIFRCGVITQTESYKAQNILFFFPHTVHSLCMGTKPQSTCAAHVWMSLNRSDTERDVGLVESWSNSKKKLLDLLLCAFFKKRSLRGSEKSLNIAQSHQVGNGTGPDRQCAASSASRDGNRQFGSTLKIYE